MNANRKLARSILYSTHYFNKKVVSRVMIVLLVVSNINFIHAGNNLEEQSLGGSGAYSLRQSAILGSGTADGSFQYTYPISLPPGRNDLTPDLMLSYSSQQMDDQSFFGDGWKFSIPIIERLNKSGVENLYGSTTETFYSSLDGELVQIGSTDKYRARQEIGDFRTYTFNDNYWTIKDKEGRLYTFGTTSISRLDNASGTKIYRWYLDEERDTNDNYISYHYAKHGRLPYPTTINYTGHDATEGIYSIKFSTSSAASSVNTYNLGFSVERTIRIDEITVYADGRLIHQYDLAFETGVNDKRDLLSGITETGYSLSATTALPEVQFTYNANLDESWSIDNNYDNTFPEGVAEGGGYKDNGVRLVDINGDGLTDMVRFYKLADYDEDNHYTVKTVHINQGNGNWDVDADWDWDDLSLPFLVNEDGITRTYHVRHDMGVRFADVNADGLVDIVTGLTCPGSCNDNSFEISHVKPENSVYINTGSGWKKNVSWSGIPTFANYDPDSEYMQVLGTRLADVNADGLPDLIDSYWIQNSTSTLSENVESEVHFNTGSGWVKDPNYNDVFPAPFTKAPAYSVDLGSRLADVNNDGLIDIIRSYDKRFSDSDPDIDDISTYINTGSGWEKDTGFVPPGPFIIGDHSDTSDRGYRLMDVNGDGFIDVTRSNDESSEPDRIWRNTGSNFSGYNKSIPDDFAEDYNNRGDTGLRLADLNGDNLPDIIDALDSGTTTGTGQLYVNQQVHTDLISKVTTAEGGTINVTYDGLQSTLLGTTTDIGFSPFTPIVVDTITYDSGQGNIWAESFEYKQADFYYDESDLTTRHFTGFGKVTKITDLVRQTTYYHQGNGAATSSAERADSYSKIGLPYRIDVSDLNNNLYQQTLISYNEYDLGDSAIFVSKNEEVVLQYDGDSDHIDSATEYTFSTSTGNLLQLVEFGTVSASTSGSFTDSGTDKRTTDYNYVSNTGAHIYSLPSTITVTDQSTNKVKETKLYYDNQTLNSVTDGNLTTQSDWVSNSDYVVTKWTHNPNGTIASVIDSLGATTTHSYDDYSLYVATTTNPLSQNVTHVYDYAHGQPIEKKMVTGEIFTYEYDGLGRILKETVPDPQTGSAVDKTEYTYTDTRDSFSVQQDDNLDDTNTVTSYEYLDGFGRTIQIRNETEISNQYAVSDFVYDTDGELIRESVPYVGTGTSRTVASSQDHLYTDYVYDPLLRIIQASTTLALTTTDYDQRIETVTDGLGNQKDFTYDVYGRLSKVTEHNGIATYDTSYQWDLNDNLTKITDANDNVRNLTYDGLSRRLTLEDLHAPADSNFGIWYFEYDDSNNLASTTDPKNQTINYTYDSLNRVLTENYIDEPGVETIYTYDNCTGGTGQLCSAVNTSATTTYTYDHMSNISTETKVVEGTNYTTEYEYDRQGNIELIVYPDDSEVRYTYNSANQLEKIEQKESGGSWDDILTDVDYSQHGSPTYLLYGNNASTTKTYDANELYRLESIITVATSTGGIGGPGAEHAEIEHSLELTNETVTEIETLTQENDPDTNDGETVIKTTTTTLSDLIADDFEAIEEVDINQATSSQVEFETEISTSSEETIFDLPQTIDPIEISTSSTTATSTEQTIELSEVGLDVFQTTPAVIESIEPITVKADTISEQLRGLKAVQKANIKAQEIEKVLPTKKVKRKKQAYEIEIVDSQVIDGGIELFVRGWQNGKQLSFGPDGSVEIERFRIFNPPILVEDDNGDIVREYYDEDVGTTTLRYREDPETAVYEVLSQTLDVKKEKFTDRKMIKGKVGNTTSVFYPDADPESSTVDGFVRRHYDDNWSSIRSKLGTQYYSDEASGWVTSLQTKGTTNEWDNMGRGVFTFNTGSIPDTDTVTDATFSFYVKDVQGTSAFGGMSLAITDHDNYQNTHVSGWDYKISRFGDRYASDTPITSYSGGSYHDHQFTNAGREMVDKTGITFIGTITAEELDNNEPSWQSNKYMKVNAYNADETGTTKDPKLVVEHTYIRPPAPTSPTLLETEGQTNPTEVTDVTPEFTAIYNDPDSGDQAIYYRLQVDNNSDFSSTVWDSGKTGLATTTEGNRSAEITYGGSALTTDLTYYWRIKFWDDDDLEGDWSTSTATFLLVDVPEPVTGTIQFLTYAYDAIGNITEIVDYAELSRSSSTYEYDDLYRLIAATSTFASSSDYSRLYTYNALGNITSKGDQGTYTYAGTHYANPHAVTSVNTVTYYYDKNGNVASTSDGLVNTWNYRDELTEFDDGLLITGYGYDHNGDRIFKSSASSTTYYPFSNYEVTDTGTTTKHIYIPMSGTLVATIEGTGAGALTYYNHLDHLGSTNVVTDGIGYTDQLLTYYPFGTTHIDTQYGSNNQTKRFTGHDYDEETDLTYMKARYYDGQVGRFNSMDPVSLSIGNSRQLQEKTKVSLDTYLRSPQTHNTYSYAFNNPLVYEDKSGEYGQLVVLAARAAIASGLIGIISESAKQIYSETLGSGNVSTGQYLQNTAQTAVGDAAAGVFEPVGVVAETVAGTASGYVTSDSSTIFGRAIDGAVEGTSVLTTEAIMSRLPGVRGVDVSTFSERFFNGAHTERLIQVESLEKIISETVSGLVESFERRQQRDEEESN